MYCIACVHALKYEVSVYKRKLSCLYTRAILYHSYASKATYLHHNNYTQYIDIKYFAKITKNLL